MIPPEDEARLVAQSNRLLALAIYWYDRAIGAAQKGDLADFHVAALAHQMCHAAHDALLIEASQRP